jgi:hypothetical protein
MFVIAMERIFVIKPDEMPGELGDGTTAARVAVSDTSDRVYFRPHTGGEVWEVLNRENDIPWWPDFPVVVRRTADGKDWIVDRADYNALAKQEELSLRYVAKHASQHMARDDYSPDDPVYVYRRMIVSLRGQAVEGQLKVSIQPGSLPWNNPNWYSGGVGPDLSGHVPASGERWVHHYLDRDALIRIVVGAQHATADRELYPAPTSPEGTIPIVNALLFSGTTELEEGLNLYDARKIVMPNMNVSGPGSYANRQVLIALMEEYDRMWTLHLTGGV